MFNKRRTSGWKLKFRDCSEIPRRSAIICKASGTRLFRRMIVCGFEWEMLIENQAMLHEALILFEEFDLRFS